jgi:hypothetical protein
VPLTQETKSIYCVRKIKKSTCCAKSLAKDVFSEYTVLGRLKETQDMLKSTGATQARHSQQGYLTFSRGAQEYVGTTGADPSGAEGHRF